MKFSPFKRILNAEAIAAGVRDIPAHWSLTPLQEKKPLRKGWQSEPFIPHEKIADLILNGEHAISKKTYKRFWSGFGLRLGEASGGLLAVDVDGASAEPILQKMSGGNIPSTVSATSGKTGRYQLILQIPDNVRADLKNFTRSVFAEWGDLKTTESELLEFRYNRCQSALPPSFHPQTGAYKWINSPDDTAVAIAPDWLCEILLKLAAGEQQNEQAKLQAQRDRERIIQEAAEQRKALGIVGSIDLIDAFSQSIRRLTPEEIFNWSGHNFKSKGKEWFGCCPQHQSQSGESFTVRPDSLDWYCFGCNVGGGVGEYRHFVKGGNGTPKGKDFFEVTKELAAQAWIELPKPQNEKNELEQSQPDPAEYAAYLQHEQEQIEAEIAQSKERQNQSKQSYPEKAKAAWRKARRFTADIQKASQWFGADLPPGNSIFFGRAGLGRGKSTQLVKWVEEWKKLGNSFICLGYRNTLLIQLCQKLGFYHLHDKDAAIMRHDPRGGIALCVDSLWRFDPEDFDGKIIILDEVMSIIRHLLHSSTVKNRDNILELFHQAILRASQLVCLDGNLADWAVKYLNALAPDKKIIRLENTYRGNKAHVNFLIGTIDIDEEVKKNDRSPWLHQVLNNSRVPVICTDSQVFAESLDNLLSAKGLKVLRIDSKTVPEDYVKELLKNCDEYIEKNLPDVIIYTPSAESGVDISIKNYFTDHFGFFFGVLGVDAILQMMGRIRDSKCEKFIWVREWVAQSEATHSRSPFAKSVSKAIEKLLIQDITDTCSLLDRSDELTAKLKAIVEQSKNPHFEASNQIQAIDNFEKSNLRECVMEALKEVGYSVDPCTFAAKEDSEILVKKATEATKRQNCHDIFTAEKVDADHAEEISRNLNARWEERVKAIQAFYRKRLPGIDETESWSEDFIFKIRYENPDFISQQEIFWLMKHPDECHRMNLEKYHRMAQKEHTFIGNIRSRAAKVKALRDIGISYFITPNNTWHEDSPELVQLIEQCKDEKIVAALGRHPGNQKNIRFLGSLLKILGLKHTGQKIRSDDGDYRIYQLDLDLLNNPDRLNALQCLDTRWQNYLTKEVEILDWNPVLDSQEVPTNENLTCQQGGGHSQQAKQPQNITQQALDPVPGTPSESIYIINGFVEQNKSHDVELGVVEQLPLLTPLESLISALESCQSISQFDALTQGYSVELVEDAIALQPDQPRRKQLTQWLENLNQPAEEVETQPFKVRSWQWSELPLVKSVLRWIDRTEQVRVLAVDADGFCQVRSLLSGLTTNTHINQLTPVSG
jgi:hypothetical protein